MTNRTQKIADMALEQLLVAFACGELNGGYIDWEHIETAFEHAKEAFPGRYEAILTELSHPQSHE